MKIHPAIHTGHESPSRRDFLARALPASALLASVSPLALFVTGAAAQQPAPFAEIKAGLDGRDHVAEGYAAQVLIAWGDPVLPGAPAFHPLMQTAEKQKQQFGNCNDYICFTPLGVGAQASSHGLLCVNHEYAFADTMHPLAAKSSVDVHNRTTRALAEIEMASTGGSILEIKREGGRWGVVAGSRYNRRLHTDTPFAFTGPAAGSERLKTSEDSTGKSVLGMLGNCAGGHTPWGTWLSGEENVQSCFIGRVADDHREANNYKRFGQNGRIVWGRWHKRFDIAQEPNELNRFGWICEIDPLDPASTPRKHTALGRFKHEGASVVVNADGRVVVYMGDDERFEMIYRFISSGRYEAGNRAANLQLLASGELSVARFNADMSCEWLPLVFGAGALTPANGFFSQADVMIETRRAAEAAGGTRMDRPEDIEVSPVTGKIYVALTYNDQRKPDNTNAVNPRGPNRFGHILEMIPPDGDHAAIKFRFEPFVLCGDPGKQGVGATFHPATTENGWFDMPDNLAFDAQGRLWVATDGNEPKLTGRGDGVWMVETEGPMRGLSRHFFRAPAGAEATGPFFTPDNETLFVSVQHPGSDGPEFPEFGRFSSFEDPSTRWPDFKPDLPPRSAVVAITKTGGGRIGG